MPFTSFMKNPSRLTLQMLGLRLKLHIVNCEIHPDEKVLKYFEGPSGFNVDFEMEQPSIIYDFLSKSPYIRYSSILILINCYCSCRNKVLSKILKAIQCNKNINHKLKLIYTSYNLESTAENLTNIWENNFETHINNLLNNDELRNTDEGATVDLDKVIDRYEMESRHITSDDTEPLKDYLNFELSYLENTLLFREFIQVKDSFDRAQLMDYMLYILDCEPFISVQELKTFLPDSDYKLSVHTKGSIDLYFYSVNPTLAVINNNYIFTNNKPGCGIREGSEKDVRKLIQELKIARIPYILTEDLNRSQLLKFVEYLRQKDLKALKSFIFFTMTHGISNNIIYTHDGQLNFIEDILKPLQSNKTLSETNISFVNVQCRGELSAQNCDPGDFDEIQPTQIEQIQPNTCVIYSVPDQFLSPRYPKIGTPFVESFCKSFREINYQTDVKTLCKKTWNVLKNDEYYEYMDSFEKSLELVEGDETIPRYIKSKSTSAAELIPLIESIEGEFHDLNNIKRRDRTILRRWIHVHLGNTYEETACTSFCICANINEKKFSKNLKQLKYLSSELDEDTYYVEQNIL